MQPKFPPDTPGSPGMWIVSSQAQKSDTGITLTSLCAQVLNLTYIEMSSYLYIYFYIYTQLLTHRHISYMTSNTIHNASMHRYSNHTILCSKRTGQPCVAGLPRRAVVLLESVEGTATEALPKSIAWMQAASAGLRPWRLLKQPGLTDYCTFP